MDTGISGLRIPQQFREYFHSLDSIGRAPVLERVEPVPRVFVGLQNHRLCRNVSIDSQLQPPQAGFRLGSRLFAKVKSGEQIAQFILHLPTIDDQIDQTALQKELGRLESFRQFFIGRFFNDAATGKAN